MDNSMSTPKALGISVEEELIYIADLKNNMHILPVGPGWITRTWKVNDLCMIYSQTKYIATFAFQNWT